MRIVKYSRLNKKVEQSGTKQITKTGKACDNQNNAGNGAILAVTTSLEDTLVDFSIYIMAPFSPSSDLKLRFDKFQNMLDDLVLKIDIILQKQNNSTHLSKNRIIC